MQIGGADRLLQYYGILNDNFRIAQPSFTAARNAKNINGKLYWLFET